MNFLVFDVTITTMLLFVADMHELTLIHTDLKPENILLVSSEYVRVSDYKVLESVVEEYV